MNELASIGLNITSWEIILILFLIGAGFLLGFFLGKEKVFVLLLGSYISFAILNVIPFSKIFPKVFASEENFVILIVIFFALIGLVYFLFTRSFFKASSRRKIKKSVIQTLFLSFFFVGIIISVIFSFLPKDLLSQFSNIILDIFNNSIARTIWLIIPIIFIGLVRKKR
ncbi:hypothetical protein KKA23_01140 [Patescibacteria group bacterium]|nr:hypothetical protein [Patescibacteria group bacterium]